MLSCDPVRIVFPSGLYATDDSVSVCPVNFCSCSPVSISHRRAVSSADPVIIVFPYGLYATEKIEPV